MQHCCATVARRCCQYYLALSGDQKQEKLDNMVHIPVIFSYRKDGVLVGSVKEGMWTGSKWYSKREVHSSFPLAQHFQADKITWNW